MTATSSAAWVRETDAGGITWLTFDKPGSSTNTLSRDTLLELDAHLKAVAEAVPKGLVIRSGKSGGFIAGADVKEFGELRSVEQGVEMVRGAQAILARLEALPCPSVAVINGFALGGGLELALACRYRIAISNDKPILGLPEVQLGIHPGFGGTVRTVRISGVRAAMQLMLTGQPITADKALRQ